MVTISSTAVRAAREVPSAPKNTFGIADRHPSWAVKGNPGRIGSPCVWSVGALGPMNRTFDDQTMGAETSQAGV
jgi:hypothetical protein